MEDGLYKRIKLLCAKRGITISKLETDLNFGNGSIKKWEKTSSPSINKIIKLASYFNVSADYLLGQTDIELSMSEIIGDEDIISFQRAREKMSDADKKRMMQMLRLGFEYAFREDNSQNND